MLSDLPGSVEILAALEDETRRELYLFVRGSDAAVTREEAAASVGISARLAAFHLDKLVTLGLLEAHYARKPGRSGPGAGRTSKFYRRSDLEVDVSIPERRYGFLGEALVAAVAAEGGGESAQAAAARILGEHGRTVGAAARRGMGVRRPGRERSIQAAREVLGRYGFEPVERDEGTIALRNCPYERLARRSPEVVCAINHAFVEGVLRGLGARSIEATLDPIEGGCCVQVRRVS
jgi:predicted ArsR family transcriptional regulator